MVNDVLVNGAHIFQKLSEFASPLSHDFIKFIRNRASIPESIVPDFASDHWRKTLNPQFSNSFCPFQHVPVRKYFFFPDSFHFLHSFFFPFLDRFFLFIIPFPFSDLFDILLPVIVNKSLMHFLFFGAFRRQIAWSEAHRSHSFRHVGVSS